MAGRRSVGQSALLLRFRVLNDAAIGVQRRLQGSGDLRRASGVARLADAPLNYNSPSITMIP